MVYEGYLSFGGNEIVNSERARGYARSADCPMGWLKDVPCASLPDALGDGAYNYVDIANAPWYDSAMADVSSRFFGLFGLGIQDMNSSTRTAQVSEGVDNGGVIGRTRKGPKRVKVRAMLMAKGADALEYGHEWLNAALDPDACGQHGTGCGTTDLRFFTACPPMRGTVLYYTDWVTQWSNLIADPSFEGAGPATVVRTQRVLNPSFEVDLAGWNTSGVSSTLTCTTAQAHRGSASMQIATTGATAGEGAYTNPGAGGAITAGTLFSASAWVYAPVGAKMEILATCTGSGGTTAITRFDGTGTWQYVKAEGANPPSNLNPYVVIRTSTAGGQAAQAVTFYVDEVILEYTPTIGSYFDGANRPILRTNVIRDPAPTAATLWDAIGGSTRTYANGEITVVCPGSAANEGVSTYSNTATSIDVASGGMWVNAPAGTLLYVEVRANSQSVGAARVNFTATGNWQYVTAQGATSATSGGVHLVMVRTQGPTAVTFKVKQAIVQVGPTVGAYFDGGSAKPGFVYGWTGAANGSASTEVDADFSVRWASTANNSISELTGVSLPGIRSNQVAAVRSTRWSAEGAYSIRVIPTVQTNNSYIEWIPAPTSPTGPMTGVATMHLDAPLTGVMGYKARRGSFYWIGGTADSPTLGNTVGDQEMRLSGSPATANTRFLLWHGGSYGSGDVWWDLAALVPGAYAGPAFTGRSTPADPTLQRYRWTGTADASTSVYETRELRERPETDDEYAAEWTPMVRYLHDVAATDGPYERDLMESNGFWAQIVEWTITSERAWIFGQSKQVTLPTTPSFVVEDVRYNRVPYPSMELAGTTNVPVQFNLSPNPSVETNATSWATRTVASVPAGQFTGARTTELAAQGLASYRVQVLGSATATAARADSVDAYQDVALSATPRTRYSVNLWGAMIKIAGNANNTLTSVTAIIDWLNGSGTSLGTTTVGTATGAALNGNVFQQRGILPPAGAVTARVILRGTFTWEPGNATPANRADIRLYADALTLSIP